MSSEIKCPHCEYVLDDDDFHDTQVDLWALAPKEEEAEINCPSCDKSFIVKGGYAPTYETAKTWDEIGW